MISSPIVLSNLHPLLHLILLILTQITCSDLNKRTASFNYIRSAERQMDDELIIYHLCIILQGSGTIDGNSSLQILETSITFPLSYGCGTDYIKLSGRSQLRESNYLCWLPYWWIYQSPKNEKQFLICDVMLVDIWYRFWPINESGMMK